MANCRTGDVRHIGGEPRDLSEFFMTFCGSVGVLRTCLLVSCGRASGTALFAYAIRPG